LTKCAGRSDRGLTIWSCGQRRYSALTVLCCRRGTSRSSNRLAKDRRYHQRRQRSCMNCHFQHIIVVTGRQWHSLQFIITACECRQHVRMHETARRRRLKSRSGKAFWRSHANDTFTQTEQRNCHHRHSSSTKRTKSCALRCEFKTQQHACIHSNATTSRKRQQCDHITQGTKANPDSANTFALFLFSHLKLHSAF